VAQVARARQLPPLWREDLMSDADAGRYDVRPMTDADWRARRGHARLMLCCSLAGALIIIGLGSLFLGI